MILRAALAAVLLVSASGCGGSGDAGRGGTSVPGGSTAGAVETESSFNPSDYGIESWEPEAQTEVRNDGGAAGDSAISSAPDTIQGFRVQVTITGDIDFAAGLRDSLLQALPGEWVYVVYHPPYYKIRVGNFSERFAATDMLEMLRRHGFPDAWIVPDRILRNPPPRQEEVPLLPDSAGGGESQR